MNLLIRAFVPALASAVLCLAAAHAGPTIAWVDLKDAPSEQPDPLGWLKGSAAKPTLRELVAGLHRAASDDDVAAVVIRLREPKLNRAQVEEIGAAISALRAAGKKTHVFTEIYGPAELLLGSYADEVAIQSGGAVSLPGLYMEELFLADTLGWVGVRADMVQVGDYKGAKEMLANSAPSPEWDRNISQLLDSLYASMREQLQRGRRLTPAQLDAAMQEAFLATPETAQRVGLVDLIIDRVEFEDHLAALYGEDYEADAAYIRPESADNALPLSNPFAILEMLSRPPAHEPTRDTIAVLHIEGPIVDGESDPASLLGGASVGSLTIRKALRQIESEDRIKGLIVRINSPGGSAIASESIWIGLRRVAQTRPVWVSVGSMAASGGYYIAVAGDRIFVDPSSIVGSIGVVGGKMAMGGLYDKLRVNVVPRARGPVADLMSTVRPWTDAERAFIEQRMSEIYNQFVDRVRAGRKNIDIAQTAEGRLFAGERAVALHMADEVGGLSSAIASLAAHAGLAEGSYDVMDFPPPKSLQEIIQDLADQFGLGAATAQTDAALALLREAVGPRAWPAVRDSLQSLLQLRDEPTLLVMPRAFVFR